MLDNILNRLKRQSSQSLMQGQLHFDNGVRLAAQGHYPLALLELKQATRANPDHAEARVELGLTYHKMGQLSKAIKAYLSALEIQSNLVTAYQNLGAAYDELGQFVNAFKAYAKAIVLSPQDPELRNDLGFAYFNVGSYAEAIKAFRQALNLDPNNGRAHYGLGLVYLDLGDVPLALTEHNELSGPNAEYFASLLWDKIRLQTPPPSWDEAP
jgi:Flp pilus assembly protein TadD